MDDMPKVSKDAPPLVDLWRKQVEREIANWVAHRWSDVEGRRICEWLAKDIRLGVYRESGSRGQTANPLRELGILIGMDDYVPDEDADYWSLDNVRKHILWLEERARVDGRKEGATTWKCAGTVHRWAPRARSCWCGEVMLGEAPTEAFEEDIPADQATPAPMRGQNAQPVCPGPACSFCNGDACWLCAPGTPCEHDVVERHRRTHSKPVDEPNILRMLHEPGDPECFCEPEDDGDEGIHDDWGESRPQRSDSEKPIPPGFARADDIVYRPPSRRMTEEEAWDLFHAEQAAYEKGRTLAALKDPDHRDPNDTLRTVTMTVCAGCYEGRDGECHVPGCTFIRASAPTTDLGSLEYHHEMSGQAES
jgi:hypothetical protein